MLHQQFYPNLIYLTTNIINQIFLNASRLIIFDNILQIVEYLTTRKKLISNHQYKECIINVLYNIMISGTFDPLFNFIKQVIEILLNTNDWKHFVQSGLIDKHVINTLLNRLNDETNVKTLHADKSWCRLLKIMNDSLNTNKNNLLSVDHETKEQDESKDNQSDESYYCSKHHSMTVCTNMTATATSTRNCILCDACKESLAFKYKCDECHEFVCINCDNLVQSLNRLLKMKQFGQFQARIGDCDEKSKVLKLVKCLCNMRNVGLLCQLAV